MYMAEGKVGYRQTDRIVIEMARLVETCRVCQSVGREKGKLGIDT